MAHQPAAPRRSPPIGPSVEAWRAMTADERERFLLEVLDASREVRAERAAAAAEEAKATVIAVLAHFRTGIVAALESRKLAVNDEQRASLAACDDDATLLRWFVAALSASTAEEIFSA